jgi:hypothetical protein
MTKFWLVKRDTSKAPHYDVADGYVVEALTREEALRIAIEDAAIAPVVTLELDNGTVLSRNQDAQTWSCEELQITGQSRIILQDYHHA